MNKRTILYGYEIVGGKTVVLETEAAVIRDIYADYLSGNSLKTVAAKLTEQGITYYLDKSVWTKNLIARIIVNPKYAGADGYPAIISQTDFELANKRKSEMGGTQTALPEITARIKSKMVCAECGRSMGRRNKWRSREKWMCPNGCRMDAYWGDTEVFSSLTSILNDVRTDPDLLRTEHSEMEYSPSVEVIRQKREIERMREQPKVDFGVLSKMILRCAAMQYECCPLDRGRTMTEALAERYRNLPSITMPDPTLIRETVEKIAVHRDGKMTVTFINHAEVMNRETEDETV